jgi:hypothetical protein
VETIDIQEYLDRIETLRKKMIKTGMKHGLDHPKVLEYSREIDKSHNRLMQLMKKKVKKSLIY